MSRKQHGAFRGLLVCNYGSLARQTFDFYYISIFESEQLVSYHHTIKPVEGDSFLGRLVGSDPLNGLVCFFVRERSFLHNIATREILPLPDSSKDYVLGSRSLLLIFVLKDFPAPDQLRASSLLPYAPCLSFSLNGSNGQRIVSYEDNVIGDSGLTAVPSTDLQFEFPRHEKIVILGILPEGKVLMGDLELDSDFPGKLFLYVYDPSKRERETLVIPKPAKLIKMKSGCLALWYFREERFILKRTSFH
ncbi:OLC1v1027585C1 [Oldenlandia corymbosa var. corymbosa]|uniref:OLC1v1027585C1 n=1 Tax=Oldenlandia corymbosa var. corymbosa TaxID=529605 RepID=A0AAV1CCU3_OLDCO|nr:OLC1v1027585C1 [Oldenlandia corymbosa var. corymbosa]